jgi:hypothetical protein
VLLLTSKAGLLLCSRDLSPVAWVHLGWPSNTDEAELLTMEGIAQDVFAAGTWADGSATTTVWRIPRTTAGAD